MQNLCKIKLNGENWTNHFRKRKIRKWFWKNLSSECGKNWLIIIMKFTILDIWKKLIWENILRKIFSFECKEEKKCEKSDWNLKRLCNEKKNQKTIWI